MLRPGIRGSHERFRNAFEEAGILKEFTEIVDNVNSTLIIAERYGGSVANIGEDVYPR
jgi:hypothetical protein